MVKRDIRLDVPSWYVNMYRHWGGLNQFRRTRISWVWRVKGTSIIK